MRRAAAADWTFTRQRVTRRAWTRLIGYLVVGGVVTVVTRIMFATEPATLMTGDANPAAKAPTFVAIVAVLGIAAAAVRTFRPPQLSVNHYGITVRPGAFRTLLLPWVHVEEITAVTVPGRKRSDAYLLFACDDHVGRHSGDRPRFLDRAALREANRASEGRVANYDLAIPLAGFTKEPAGLIDEVAGFAPSHVDVLNQLDKPKAPAN